MIAGSQTNTPRTTARRRAVIALATGLVAYACLHAALVAASGRWRTIRAPLYADKERKLTRLERTLPPGSPVVLILGTSRTGNAIDSGRAQVMLNATRERPVAVFNWGLPATGPVTHLLHLRQLLADGHRPALVLLEIHVPTFARMPGGPLESLFVNGAQFNEPEIDWLANYDFPTERLRREQRDAAWFPWAAQRFPLVGRVWPSLLPVSNRYDWSRNSDEFGWRPMLLTTVTPEQRASLFERARGEYQNTLTAMELGDAQVRALRDLISLCRDQGIRLAFLRMPEGTGFRAFYSHATTVQIDRFLAMIAAESGCDIVNAREWMPDDAFADGHHMMPDSTAAFTERLTREAIAPQLDATAGPRQ